MLARSPLPTCLLLLAALLGGPASSACSVPVFYYALGRWTPSSHRLETPAGSDDGNRTALAHSNAALTQAGDHLRAFFPGAATPWCDQQPAAAERSAFLKLLLDSPQRAELVRRLASGSSGVWILLTCGDQARDDAAARLLQDRLHLIETTATLPAPDAKAVAGGNSGDAPDLAVKPRLQFSVLRIARGDPAETGLTAQLLALCDNPAARSLPIVVPVFGRGRALGVLCGSTLTASRIDDACLFLVGSCSCEAKESNAGVDLLLDADWDRLVAKPAAMADPAPAPAPGPASPSPASPPAKPLPGK